MTSMHFFRGMEGKRASASKETSISSVSSLTFFIFLMKSKEFLQPKVERLRRGRRIGMRKVAKDAWGQPQWAIMLRAGKFLPGL